MNGALGAGVYFAESSAYSLTYSMKSDATAAPIRGQPMPTSFNSAAAALVAAAQAAGYGGMAPVAGSFFAWQSGPAAPPAPIASSSKFRKAAAAAVAAGSSAADHVWKAPLAMLLCNVTLGVTSPGSLRDRFLSLTRSDQFAHFPGAPGMRLPPPGSDSVSGASGIHSSTNYALFDNTQAYPAYLVHFTPK